MKAAASFPFCEGNLCLCNQHIDHKKATSSPGHVQVVDLEVAADHRGSILGDHPTRLQPPQKMFESKLLHQMRNFSVDRPVFIESESSLVGRRQVPAAMWKVPALLLFLAVIMNCVSSTNCVFRYCGPASIHGKA